MKKYIVLFFTAFLVVGANVETPIEIKTSIEDYSPIVKNPFYLTYYVTTSGSSSNNGLSEGSAWSLSHAFDNAISGDVVYVKAGNYGALQKTITTSGVSFIGYKNSIGDIVADIATGNTLFTSGTVNVAESPCFVGTITNNRPNQDAGIRFTGSNVTVKNFAFYSYNVPFESTGDNCIIDNVFTSRAGNHNPADLTDFSYDFPDGAYTGWGMKISGDNPVVTNGYVLNAGAEGFKLNDSDNAYVENFTVVSALGVGSYNKQWLGDGNGTDYHFLVGNNTHDGYFKNLKIYHAIGSTGGGHGIISKTKTIGTGSSNHVFDGFYVENTKFEVQFPNAHHITFKNGEIKATNTDSRVDDTAANIANGGNNITIENVKFSGGAGLQCRGWDDTYDTSYTYALQDCYVYNCWFDGAGVYNAAWLTYGPDWPLTASHTISGLTFDHCTFDNYNRFMPVDSPTENIVIKNSIITNMTNYSGARYFDGSGPLGGTTGPYTLNVTQNTNNYYSNNFSNPSGTNITSLDPVLVDGITTNATLLTGGVATSQYAAGLPIGYIGGVATQSTPTGQNKKNKNALTGIIN